MNRINLKSGETAASAGQQSRGSSTSVMLGIFLLVLSGALYGGLVFWKKSKVSQQAKVQASIDNFKNQIDGEDYAELYDFQSRITNLEMILEKKIRQQELLGLVSAKSLPSVRFEKLDVQIEEGGQMELNANLHVANYDELSKQLEAFGQIEGLTKLVLKSAGVSNAGGYDAAVLMTLEKSAEKTEDETASE